MYREIGGDHTGGTLQEVSKIAVEVECIHGDIQLTFNNFRGDINRLAHCLPDQPTRNLGPCLRKRFCAHPVFRPAGFDCLAPIAAGDYADTKVCVRRSSCVSNLDCEALGTIDCVNHGCFDSCLANDNCDMHQLQCEPLDELNCTCPNNAATCADDDRSCTGEIELAAGTVSTRNVCIVREANP